MKVFVLEGGFNEEHEVSLETGKQIKQSLKNLNIKYDSILVNPESFKNEIINFNKRDIFFNALHGTFGEDGTIQKILEKSSFKFTHSSSIASKIGFNKELTKKKIKKTQILTPKYLVLGLLDIKKDILFEIFLNIGPFVIKPIASGSSFGIKIFKNEKSLNLFLDDLKNNLKIYKKNQKLLIEKYIHGRELTVSVREKNGSSIPVEVTEIISKNEFFDYKSKYTTGYSKHILPADIPKKVYDKLAHDILNCNCISRSDFIFDGTNIFFLELNTQPGLTPISLVPEQLKYHDISFDELVMSLIDSAL